MTKSAQYIIRYFTLQDDLNEMPIRIMSDDL
ncbi:hypothetical protein AAUPMG_02405 [Pasteurella multocida subsp. multocida str. Anand1_goat]|nr:hypothetical protein AAUPMG_02405 [Pasteurella multocida subsp. multocida str. Anand1_goat]